MQAQPRVVAVGAQRWAQIADAVLGEDVQGYLDLEKGKGIVKDLKFEPGS